MTGATKAKGQAAKVGRECGSCDLCCSIWPIPFVEKHADGRCGFARNGVVTEMKPSLGEGGVDFTPKHHVQTGCGIYDTRPRMCRQFYCGWRLGLGEDDERPDKTGVVLDLAGSGLPEEAAVGVRVLLPRPARGLGRALYLEGLLRRLKDGTLGAKHGWPALPLVEDKETKP